jgi:predicted amidohydrolase
MQIASPDDWAFFDWDLQEVELKGIADACGRLGIFAVVGGAHRLTTTHRPHNSVYIFSDRGKLLTRYDKRFLSHSENTDWYTPGRDPIIFEVDGYRFGCAICIEAQFYEVFAEYERLDVDAVLFLVVWAARKVSDRFEGPCEPELPLDHRGNACTEIRARTRWYSGT